MKRLSLALFGVLFLCLLSVSADAYILSGYPKFFATDTSGVPLSGGKLYTYEPGSSTPKATYTTSTGTAHTNPIILDSRGEATVYWNGSYKIILKDSDDTTIWTLDNFQGTGVNYDTTTATSGWVAISAETGTSTVRFIPTISGASITAASIPSTALVDPIEAGVSAASKSITGSVYVVDLTKSESLAGATVYGSEVGNWGATSEVTATLPTALKGMNLTFMLTQGQITGKTIFVIFPATDTVLGLTANFSSSNSAVQISGATMQAFMVLRSRLNNYWHVVGVSGITYRNK